MPIDNNEYCEYCKAPKVLSHPGLLYCSSCGIPEELAPPCQKPTLRQLAGETRWYRAMMIYCMDHNEREKAMKYNVLHFEASAKLKDDEYVWGPEYP